MLIRATVAVLAVTVTSCGGGGGGSANIPDPAPTQNWQTASLIESGSDAFAWAPDVGIDGNGNAVAVWQQGNSIWANRYVSGVGWGTEIAIDGDNPGGALEPKISVDENGNAIVVWTQFDGAENSIWANRYSVGVGWESPVLIENNDGTVWLPDVEIDGEGNAIAVWAQSNGSVGSVWSNRYTEGVGWGLAEQIENESADGGAFGAPRIAVNIQGDAVVVWANQVLSGTTVVLSRTDIWSNRYVSGVGWAGAEIIENSDDENAVDPVVSIDENGGAIAVWQQGGNIMSNRLLSGSGWEVSSQIETIAGLSGFPEIVTTGSGKALAIWRSYDGSRQDIWANSYTDEAGWGTERLVEIDNSGTAWSPRAAADSEGNVTVVWAQSDGTRENIWSSRYEPVAGWKTPIVIETIDSGSGSSPVIEVNGSGAAVAVWYQADALVNNVMANLYK